MKKRRLLALLLCAAMMLTIMPATAFALDMQDGLPAFVVNENSASVVGFGGKQWVVIGHSGTGVASSTGTLTLLLAGGQMPATRDYHYTNGNNEYDGSILQGEMNAQYTALGDGEKAVISGRTLTGDGVYPDPDNIAGSTVLDAKFWPLSVTEANAVNDTLRTTDDYSWWLRSPGSTSSRAAVVSDTGNVNAIGLPVSNSINAVRPAFQLNLSSVLFSSAASGTSGKSAATIGSGLVGANVTTGAVKFTIQSASQTLTVNATIAQSTQSASTLAFSYGNATTGSNQYISCVLVNGTDEVKYYGKLADSSGAASGSLSIPLSGVADGTYTLEIFSEEANDDNFTDFCSTPVTMTVTVSGGTGTVSSFGGTVELSDNAELSTVAGQAVTATGTGTSVSPKTAAVSVVNSVSSVALSDIVASDINATVALYSDNGYAQNKDAMISLTAGGATHVYIMVIAADGTTIYYDVTVNRAIVVTGLPTTYTMYDNGRVTWNPQPDGGTWKWDESFFSANFNGAATFTALKAGTSTITYTVSGVSQSITVTISESVLPLTGQDFAWVWVLGAFAVLCGGAAVLGLRLIRQRVR